MLSLVMACLTSALAGTTGTIEGRVTDVDGRPLPEAVITLYSERVHSDTHSDRRGYFHFLSLYPDLYHLFVHRGGNAWYSARPFEVHADQVTICNVRLHRAITGIYATRPQGNRVIACSY
ncbi:MAG TPA: carboxypeptidase-like regulatory domain-containing protein [Candidatus Limnocylindrales bacterium]|nr:carboxypeptidase-like regulatory domain-containing protein [Candidatus Limnocylindrales bacterium]